MAALASRRWWARGVRTASRTAELGRCASSPAVKQREVSPPEAPALTPPLQARPQTISALGGAQVFLIIPSPVVFKLASRTVRAGAEDGDELDAADDLLEPPNGPGAAMLAGAAAQTTGRPAFPAPFTPPAPRAWRAAQLLRAFAVFAGGGSSRHDRVSAAEDGDGGGGESSAWLTRTLTSRAISGAWSRAA